ncbi:MAG: hypothetical protein MJ228_02500 [Bacilli bacterium]|nr:hypothetical protein [Bacilli bacterium]
MKNISKQLKSSFIVMIITLSLAIVAGGTVFAWFTSHRSADVGVMSLVLGGDRTEAEIKYCSFNKHNDVFLGYKANDSRITEASTFSYDSLFFTAGEEEKSSLEYAPGYSFTFAIEVTNGNPSMTLSLSKYTAQINYAVRRTTNVAISLAEVLDVYTAVYNNKPTSEELSAYFLAQGIVGEDKFDFSAGTDENGLSVSIPFASDFDGSNAYILMTLYFSNDPSTWYGLDTESDEESMVGNGTNNTITLSNTPKGMPAVTIHDSITASGASKNVSLSAAPYQISSLTLNGNEQELGTDYTVQDNVINFFAVPANGDAIEVTYAPYSSEWSLDGTTLTFESAPFAGSLVNVSYNYELETYEKDPINGNSNVYEGLRILLNVLSIS